MRTLKKMSTVMVVSMVLAIGFGPAARAAACDDADRRADAAAQESAQRPDDGRGDDRWAEDEHRGDRGADDDRGDHHDGDDPTDDATDDTSPNGRDETAHPEAGHPDGGAATTEQDTHIAVSGDARADTGGNTLVISGDDEQDGTGDGAAAIDSGDAVAIGNDSRDTIVQTALAVATDRARIELLQIALVINIGIASAESGGNAAGAVAGVTGAGAGAIDTGSVRAVGNSGTTRVVQAVVLSGTERTGQTADVVTAGIGIADSGGNAVIVAPGTDTTDTAGAVSVSTGRAGATGNRSTTQIVQVIMVSAADDGTLRAVQRAVVLDVGAALARTEANGAGAAPAAAPEQQMMLAVLGALFGLEDRSGAAGTIATGDASAVGNATTTEILQRLSGSITGDDDARALQDAFVGNVGLALASSGGNGGDPSGLGLADGALDGARARIAVFLAAVGSGDTAGVGDLAETLQLGSGALSLDGAIDSFEWALDEGTPRDVATGGAQVIVRQVSAVLNLGFSFADSGNNEAVVRRDRRQARVDARTASAAGTASIATGPARAVGNRFVIAVCQAGGGASCDAPELDEVVTVPPAAPTSPAGPVTAGPDVAGATATRAAADPGTNRARATGNAMLPFTGADIGLLMLAGLGLVGIGTIVVLRTRRSRPVHD